ncbi:MAG TPA: helix-turn-helix domain-containing protein [Haliangium sp.]|nr:helix-turn-helix domain-containing protein [Haliangium sp.]
MTEDLLTTREAADLLGVGTTSIKRWADSGFLQCVKTLGGHRRFPRNAVEALIGQTLPTLPPRGGRVMDWISTLTGKVQGHQVADALEAEREERGSWAAVADALGPVLEEIGRGWARGEISVIEEHIASERLIRAVTRCGENIRVPASAPACLLMTAERDEHTVGLSLAELALREQGWRALWSGAGTPVYFACELIAAGGVEMVGVSASQHSRDSALLADQIRRLGESCRKRKIPLVLGGCGLWPEKPEYGHRVRSCTELQRVLAGS